MKHHSSKPTWTSVFLVAALAGCLGSEVGNPPFDPETDPTPLAMDTIVFEINPAGVGPFVVTIPREALDGATEVTVTNLSEMRPAEPLNPNDDEWLGAVNASSGDILRFSARVDGRWMVPADFSIQGDMLSPVGAPRCLEWERRTLSRGDVARVRNRCDETLAATATTRRGLWNVSPPMQSLAPGGVASFELTPVDDEDTLRIDAAGDTVDFSLRP